MKLITSTVQLHRGQRVIMIERGGDIIVNYYRFISEDLSNCQDLRARYGYFADMADRPVRFYLSEKNGAESYADYTDEEIILLRKEHLEKSLATIEKALKAIDAEVEDKK